MNEVVVRTRQMAIPAAYYRSGTNSSWYRYLPDQFNQL